MANGSIPRRPPADVRRELRQEANFGCVICGVPIIQYHHIVPFAEEKHHDPDRMVALCPNHHDHAGPNAEALTPDQLYEYKENPHNSQKVEYEFFFESGNPYLKLAGNYFQVTEDRRMTILEVEGESLFDIGFRNGILTYDLTLYDEDDNLMAEIKENEWIAYTDEVWDMEYRKNKFSIWHEPRDIGLKLEYSSDDDLVALQGSFYHSGVRIEAKPSGINAPGLNMTNSRVYGFSVAIALSNIEGELRVTSVGTPR
ncbi:HNH endonuclease [Halogeometricum sp. CBA1124]|uniref:HNH endonuclease n=1 Tax=Halogeometricum sp. CBA1124 TaxID=2668071 RepID=UPI00142B8BB8|nr:HNH endonuclease [Halogeometricum sp. CBA1124]MUV57471.1 hypothetical protein [Halogeometricum sp. CBA1124]